MTAGAAGFDTHRTLSAVGPALGAPVNAPAKAPQPAWNERVVSFVPTLSPLEAHLPGA
ncbi:MAG: hypothetical protein ACRDL7_07125 [Gaiellaceae bacterium]